MLTLILSNIHSLKFCPFIFYTTKCTTFHQYTVLHITLSCFNKVNGFTQRNMQDAHAANEQLTKHSPLKIMEDHKYKDAKQRYETYCLALWRSFQSLVTTSEQKEEKHLVQTMVRLWGSVILLLDLSNAYVGRICRSIRHTCEKSKQNTLSHLRNFLKKGVNRTGKLTFVQTPEGLPSPNIFNLLHHLVSSCYLNQTYGFARKPNEDLDFAQHILFTNTYYTKEDMDTCPSSIRTIDIHEDGPVSFGEPEPAIDPTCTLQQCFQWYNTTQQYDEWTDCSTRMDANSTFKVRVNPNAPPPQSTFCSQNGVFVHNDSFFDDTFEPTFDETLKDDDEGVVTVKCDVCGHERRFGCMDQLTKQLGITDVRDFATDHYQFSCYHAALECSTEQPNVLKTLHPYGVFQFALQHKAYLPPVNPPVNELIQESEKSKTSSRRQSTRLKRKRG